MGGYEAEQGPGLSPRGGTWPGPAVYTPPPRPTPHSPILPAPDFPISLRTSGKQVQEDGGGARVWVPSIALGWDWGGFPPPALPRALGRSCAWGSRVGGETLILKLVPNFSDDYDGCEQ